MEEDEPVFNTAKERDAYYAALHPREKTVKIRKLEIETGEVLSLNYKNVYATSSKPCMVISSRAKKAVSMAIRRG